MMWHRYDVESDQLKCNFCTQWFKCSLHYANLQRYSLKACQKCLNNFSYTILHPDSYKIYKVLLLDSNIAIGQSKVQTEMLFHELSLQLQAVEQEVKDKLGQFFEAKIRETIKEMQRSTKRLEDAIKEVKKEFFAQNKDRQSELTQNHKELAQIKINNIKEAPLDKWFRERPHEDHYKLSRNASAVFSSLKKAVQKQEKENFNPNNKESFCKSIKKKATGHQDSKAKLKYSECLELPMIDSQRPKSLTKSSHSKSRKKIENPLVFTTITPYEQRDLTQIEYLMDSATELISYLPCTVQTQKSGLIKNQSKRTQADIIIDLRNRTSKDGELIQLIGADTSKINFECYLKSLGLQSAAKTVRIIKAGLTDYEFDSILRFLSCHPCVQTLIVTNNRLTELSVMALQIYLSQHRGTNLRHVYLGNNWIVREKAIGLCRSLCEFGVQVCL